MKKYILIIISLIWIISSIGCSSINRNYIGEPEIIIDNPFNINNIWYSSSDYLPFKYTIGPLVSVSIEPYYNYLTLKTTRQNIIMSNCLMISNRNWEILHIVKSKPKDFENTTTIEYTYNYATLYKNLSEKIIKSGYNGIIFWKSTQWKSSELTPTQYTNHKVYTGRLVKRQ